MGPANCYDIHGIVTVDSATPLPELEPFRTDAVIPEPTVRVRIDGGAFKRRASPAASAPRAVRFVERWGAHGFGIEIAFGQVTDVVATPLLGRSPHVLYTNVVEPILRWAVVERGYALVHGACLALNDEAFLITARTDTGKTTTVLRTLDTSPEFAFLSDDLTLLAPDGRVLPYPKPLTISRHTLVAVHAPLLSWAERLSLIVQSRLHSKSGRRFGLLLAKSGLPMATTNAVTQYLIPPPKYPVQRLVPGVRVAGGAKLQGMVVIERGPDGQVWLDADEALSILLRNCEDSYGFPPYDDIKESLYLADGRDLRVSERETVQTALAGRPAILMRSQTRDWWKHLPAFVGSALAMDGYPGVRSQGSAALATVPAAVPAD